MLSLRFADFSRRAVGVPLLLWLAVSTEGCTVMHQDPVATQTNSTDEVLIRPFPANTLYALLVAEFAGSRNYSDVAVKNYTEQAQQTRDIDVVRRATLIAQYMGADEATLTNAMLWNQLEPGSDEASAVLAAQMLKQDKRLEAFDYSLALLKKGYQPPFQSIAAQTSHDTAEQRAALMTRFNDALVTYPHNAPLLLGKALQLLQRGEENEALRFSNKAIAADESSSAACLLSANLLEHNGKIEEAAKILAKRMHVAPYDQRVHLQYARLLSQYDLKESQKQFKLLVDKNPFDADLLLALAIVSKEAGDIATAKEYFEQLLFIQKHTSSAYFYLGQINEANGDRLHALESFRRVSEGEEYFYAMASFCRLALKDNNLTQCLQQLDEERIRVPTAAPKLFLLEANILQNRKDYPQSLATLNRGLTAFPDEPELLYSRSIVQEALGHLTDSEADLRRILEKDTNNANALNALGYVLANKTDRLQEAHELISRALTLDPENPAITDSMGWVLYRMNRSTEALPYLQKAMKLLPNHEIAAHLGEVLWVTGKQKEARKVWMQGIDDDPDSEIIKETLQRLNAK